jgi:SAM-dependent methyltransferase
MLVDHLLRQGYSDLTVLDISGESLLQARQRLGVAADRVHWLETDITRFVPSRTYALWHDRAAFHFLTEARDRACYIAALCRALMPGGQAVIAAFAPEGPQRCSGLNIVQYDGDTLARELGSGFRRVESRSETHLTPQGREQKFGFHRFVREG